MRQLLSHYLVVLAIFLAIDAAWLSTAGRTFYVSEIGSLLRERPNFAIALVFYAIYAAGLLYFVVQPALEPGDLWRAFLTGAAFGLVAYGTYDMTNLATIKGFTIRVALVDMAWGSLLSGSSCSLAVWLIRLFKLA